MAKFSEKFNEVKTLIQQSHPHQAVDECDNGINNECVNARNEFDNVTNKLIEKYPDEGLLTDLQGVTNTYFDQP